MRFSAMLGAMLATVMGSFGGHQQVPQFLPDAYNPMLPLLPMPHGFYGRSRSPGGRAHKRWKTRRASGRV